MPMECPSVLGWEMSGLKTVGPDQEFLRDLPTHFKRRYSLYRDRIMSQSFKSPGVVPFFVLHAPQQMLDF